MLDADGEHAPAERADELHEALDDRAPRGVGLEPGDEVAADLEDLGAQAREAVQAARATRPR